MLSARRPVDLAETPGHVEAENSLSLIEVAMEAMASKTRSDDDDDRPESVIPESGNHQPSSSQQGQTRTAVFLKPQSASLLPWTAPLTELGEHCDALKANVLMRCSPWQMKTLVFAGVTAGCGASTVAAYFAETLASDARSTVLLIDANLRSRTGRPMGDGAEELETSFAAIIAGDKGLLIPMPDPGTLYVLPSGPPLPRPSLLFQNVAFEEFLQLARERFDYIVFDAPPLQGHPESLVLSRWADAVVLVVESEKTRKGRALWAKQQVEAAGGNLLGVVLNKRRFHIPEWIYRML